MIVRSWRAFAHSGAADQYPRHLLEVVKPRLERLTGFRGLYLLRRKDGDEVEYVVQTLWDSRAAIEAFAGPRLEEAVVEPEAAAALVRYDRHVTHYEVLSKPDRREADDVQRL